MVALENIRDFFQKLISKSDPNSEVVFEIKLRCKQHCVPAEHLDQWIASTEMDMDEKLKHPKASVLLKPKPELAYFLDFDSNTQNRTCGQQHLHGRKETNNLHKILSK